MDFWDGVDRYGKWIAAAVALAVVSVVGWRVFSTGPAPASSDGPEAAAPAPVSSPAARTGGTPSASPAAARQPETPAGPSAPPPPAGAAAKAPPPAPVRRAAPASTHAPAEVPLVNTEPPEVPRIEDLVSTPHVPTHPRAQLKFDRPPGTRLTDRESAEAVNTGVLVNLMASLRTALLRGDKTTARAIIENLPSYGDLADKALEVEETNADDGRLAYSIRKIREQVEERRARR